MGMQKHVFAGAVFIFGLSTSAQGVVEFQLMTGSSQAKSEFLKASRAAEDTASKTSRGGSEFNLGIYFDPLAGIPMGFGGVFGVQGHSIKNQGIEDEAAGSGFFGPGVTLWAPFPSFKPYVKAAYILSSFARATKYRTEEEASQQLNAPTEVEVTEHYSGSGVKSSLGIKWTPTPFFAVLFEYSRSDQSAKFQKAVIKDGPEVTSDSNKTKPWTTEGFLLGLGAHI